MQHIKIIRHSTIFIYVVTILVHIVLYYVEDGRNYLGVTMGIPLFVIFIYQKLYRKEKLVQTLAISRPKCSLLAFSIAFPISIGLLLHMFFSFWDMKFLAQDELISLILIGLTISSLSALLEEVVWRGNFHYYLRQNYSLPKVALMIAAVWSLWHLPIGLIYKGYSMPIIGLIAYVGILFVVSIVLTYLREMGRSVIPAAILHGTLNVFYLTDGVQTAISMDQIDWMKLALLTITFMILSLLYRNYKKTTKIT